MHRYICASGHEVTSVKPMETCPGYVKGSPCKSALQLWTPGRAKKKAREDAEETLLRKPKQQAWRTWGKKT